MFGNSWFESVTGYPSITAPDVDDGTVFDLWGGATNHSTYADLILPPGSTIEKAYLYELLKKNKGRIRQTAESAGVGVRQLHKLMTKYDLKKEDFKNENKNRKQSAL